MPNHSHIALNLDEVAVSTPPPYMDPGNAVAKKKMSRIRKESLSHLKTCQHCGAPPEAQFNNVSQEKVLVWPAVRPVNHIHQDSCQFVGYVMVIAIVIFLLFAACKYLP